MDVIIIVTHKDTFTGEVMTTGITLTDHTWAEFITTRDNIMIGTGIIHITGTIVNF
jgi:hypothetical protein